MTPSSPFSPLFPVSPSLVSTSLSSFQELALSVPFAVFYPLYDLGRPFMSDGSPSLVILLLNYCILSFFASAGKFYLSHFFSRSPCVYLWCVYILSPLG